MATGVETCYRHPDQETRVHCTRCGRPICPECMTPAPVGHHCPTCVAEGRRGVRRVRSALPRPRSATTVLLAVNAAVFVLDLLLGGRLLRAGAMVPVLIVDGEWWRLLTAMFLHAGLLHLALNSLALYVFGNLVEGSLGTARFLAVYMVSGFCATAVSFAFGPPVVAGVGASGAIFGCLGAWLSFNLRRRSLSLARANVQGALVLIGINLVFGLAVPGIDNLAHLGGLGAGILAGFAAEGFGPRATRLATTVAGLAALSVSGLALVVWRVSTIG